MKTKNTLPALLAALAVLALGAFAAGCGDDDETTTSAAGNATDAAFITDMTDHHQGAIEMAQVALKRAQHPEVRRLAEDIISAQKREIALMGRIGDDLRHMGAHESGHMGMSQSEMGMDMDMSMLRRGKPFDRDFIDMMVPHHRGAIAMAKIELAKGTQPELRKLARDIIGAQTKEIAEMRMWRKDWYGSAGPSHSITGMGG